jgi:hypothetical protein
MSSKVHSYCSVGRQSIPTDPGFAVSPQRTFANLPQDIPEDFDDEELAQYAEEFTKGELDEAVDEFFDWDGIDDAAFVAAFDDQEMQM